MRIRYKLLVMLLLIAVLPLLMVSWVDHRATDRLGKKLAEGAREKLSRQAEQELVQIVRTQVEVIDRDRRLIELAVKVQAREAELALSNERGRPMNLKPYFVEDYQRPESAPDDLKPDRRYHIRNARGAGPPAVSYNNMVFKNSPGADPMEQRSDVMKLTSLAKRFKFLRDSNPKLIFGQYLGLENGVFGSYPGFGGYPAEYDHRKRDWYIQTKATGQLQFSMPYIDAKTGSTIFTLSTPIHNPDGEFTGVAAIDIQLIDILQQVVLPKSWQNDAHTLIVMGEQPAMRKGPGDKIEDAGQTGPLILAKQDYINGKLQWDQPLRLDELHAHESDEMQGMIADFHQQKEGIRTLVHCHPESHPSAQCSQSLWAYGPLGAGREANLLIIVPRATIIRAAEETEKEVLDQTDYLLRVSGVVGLWAVMMVVVAAWVGARAVSRPVTQLAEAAERVAAGDFTTRVHLKTADEFQQLAESFNSMVPRLQDQIRVRQSLTVAKNVQQALLPDGPPILEGFEIAGMSVYCDETGGDYYDFLQIGQVTQKQLGIAIGDVTGHGIAAALLMATGRALLRSRISMPGSLADVLTDINRQLADDSPQGRFMTLFCLILDAEQRAARWVGAGHDPALVYCPTTGLFSEWEGTDIPLGIDGTWKFSQFQARDLREGQVIVMGTDGIWESRNNKDELFGKDAMREAIRRHASKSAVQIAELLHQEVVSHRGQKAQQDDITMIVVKVRSPGWLPDPVPASGDPADADVQQPPDWTG